MKPSIPFNLASALALGAMVLEIIPLQGTEVAINLHSVGPGVVRFARPRPHNAGDSLQITAQPLGGARFLRWSDDSVDATRSITVDAEVTSYTAEFAWELIPSQLQRHPLEPLPVTGPEAELDFASMDRVTIRFELAGRHGFRLYRSDDLRSAELLEEPFRILEQSDTEQIEGFAGPGTVEIEVAVPPERGSGFYQIALDNGLVLPVLLYAEVDAVAAGAQFNAHGLNLKNPAAVQSTAGPLQGEALDGNRLRVQAPNEAGVLTLRAEIDGVQAIGAIRMRVISASEAPSISMDTNRIAIAGGLLRVYGSNLHPGSELWLDGQRLNTLHVAADGKSLIAELPRDAVSGEMFVVSNGVLSASRQLNLGHLTTPVFAAAIVVQSAVSPNGVIQNYPVALDPLTVMSSVTPTGVIKNYAAAPDPVTVIIENSVLNQSQWFPAVQVIVGN